MITQVSHKIFIADMEGCKRKNRDDAILHSCKHPCFEIMTGKKVDKSNPNYLFLETGKDLYLNIIDPETPLFYKETFDVAIEFIKKHIEQSKVILHCNQGVSRSPQIAMLYLFNHLPYREAQNQMLDIYNDYNPSMGIDEWLGWNWTSFQK